MCSRFAILNIMTALLGKLEHVVGKLMQMHHSLGLSFSTRYLHYLCPQPYALVGEQIRNGTFTGHMPVDGWMGAGA